MYGAILGDIFGSIYEFNNRKTETPREIRLLNPACYFTDDTVMTIATAAAILRRKDYRSQYLSWGRAFPRAGYGRGFRRWLASAQPRPYNSWGNGSAMRVSPVGLAFATLEETLAEAKKSAECTHNHPEGVKGAQAAASAIFLARTGAAKTGIKSYIEKTFGYDLNRSVAAIRPAYRFNESCRETVPEAIIAFLESSDFTDALQIAISLGGDSDTLAAITGSIAEAFYGGVPQEFIEFAEKELDSSMLPVIQDFYEKIAQG